MRTSQAWDVGPRNMSKRGSYDSRVNLSFSFFPGGIFINAMTHEYLRKVESLHGLEPLMRRMEEEGVWTMLSRELGKSTIENKKVGVYTVFRKNWKWITTTQALQLINHLWALLLQESSWKMKAADKTVMFRSPFENKKVGNCSKFWKRWTEKKLLNAKYGSMIGIVCMCSCTYDHDKIAAT